MPAAANPVRCGVRVIGALACLALLPGLGAAAPAAAAVTGSGRPAGPGARLWLSSYNGGGGFDGAAAVAVSPDGGTVYVTGGSMSGAFPSDRDYATVAYNAATGSQLWASRYNGPANRDDIAAALAVSPDGGTVYVTGGSLGVHGTATNQDYATIAYDAATGAQLWVSRYNGPGSGYDRAAAVAVSPDGGRVFVTGVSGAGIEHGARGYATVAYNAATGAQAWVRRYNGHGGARAVAVSPGGGTVFVTGGHSRTGTIAGDDYVTIAYNAATGATRWLSRYNGPADHQDVASALAVRPGGREIVVTGASRGRRSGDDYATVAYNAATGARLWARRYNGPGNQADKAMAVTAGPGGHQLYVTGFSFGITSKQDYATIAYNATTGSRLWLRRYDGPSSSFDVASSVAAAPGGAIVAVTGGSFGGGGTGSLDYATIAYSAVTGAPQWVRRYDGGSADDATSVAVGAGGTTFVTGGSDAGGLSGDYVTIAYQG
jgi:hypothetical protein